MDKFQNIQEFMLSYREVIPNQTNSQSWKEISLNTGATQSSLQDIKVVEKAGGFYYKSFEECTRNRFIYWRTNRDVLELSEISLDINLMSSNVRYKFTDSPVLAVNIIEHLDSVIVLVATVSSVHHLHFPHPNLLRKRSDELALYSIFYEASANPSACLFHVVGQAIASNYPVPHTAACTMNTNEEISYFALAYQNSLSLYTMNPANGQTTMIDLKESHIMPRILSNLSEALRGKSSMDSCCATSLIFNTIGDTVFLYGLYRDDHVKMWSTRNGQCISALNCIQNPNEIRSHGVQNNLLRSASFDITCAFLCNSIGSKFIIFRTVKESSGFSLQIAATVPAPEFDLIEFNINLNRIWGLWCNSQGEYNISSYLLVPNAESNWTSAALETLPERKIKDEIDPRQANCSYLFYPGQFQRDIIDRALVMFHRSNNISDPKASLNALKDRVCFAVEQEIRTELKDMELTDELYIETSFKQWERFYSCCEQYHIKSTQPVGLFLLDNVGAVMVIKKNAYSFLRPCELLEHLMLVGGSIDIINTTQYGVDDELKNCTFEDLETLVSILSSIEMGLGEEEKIDIDTRLYNLNMPNVVISELVSAFSGDGYEQIFSRDILQGINRDIKLIPNLTTVMISLLKILRLDELGGDEPMTYDKLSQSTRLLHSTNQLFRSNVGISLLAETIRQTSLIRYSICRNLLILEYILMDSIDLQRATVEIIRSRCMPETVVFMQAYYVMVWIAETSETRPTPAALDASIQRLSDLQISDCRYKHRPNCPTTVMDQFLRGRGLQSAIFIMASDEEADFTIPFWKNTLLSLSKIVGKLTWAVSGNFIFGEWLVGSCQHILIQEYVRLLNSWCEWNKFSRHFIAAVSFLDNGEPHKALDLFMQSVNGVLIEPYLEKIILDNSIEETTQNEAFAQYFLKVIQLYEQYSAPDCIIRLAKSAIDVLEPGNPQLAMFQSIIFANHLNLEHFTAAYHSLIGNAESSRRKDCLRQLVVRLFEKQRLDLLMKFPYLGLQDELENIIESRARSMSIVGNCFYDFLYAFYVYKSNMRKAASIMYEQALRFGLECDTLPSVESRYECLQACITALHLIDEKYAWIARPVVNERDLNEDEQMDTDTDKNTLNRKVMVLELKDIKKELVLMEAIITLAKYRRELSSILNTEADELIAVLANNGLYSMAVKLAVEYERSLESILQSLAFTCIRASTEDPNETWTWLQENDLADLPHLNSAIDMAWKFLQSLLFQYEEQDSTILHRSITNKILNLGEYLPNWLFISYKKKNSSELLRLYVLHGRLIEATDLAKEYIAAMMNTGGEYFGLKNALHATLSPLCFPINTMDMLMYNLTLNEHQDKEYDDCLKELKKSINIYANTVRQISLNRIEYCRRN